MSTMPNPADHPWHHAQPWLVSTPAGFARAVDKLKQTDKERLFTVVIKAAASGDWAIFSAAMERASRVGGVGKMLAENDWFALAYLYERAGLPANLHPLFEAVTDLA